ncbi:MAG: hypothetical protein LUF89_03810 [Ruminococcus sp.]|nr:hypothetical protein [Ruminococcus sp.]
MAMARVASFTEKMTDGKHPSGIRYQPVNGKENTTMRKLEKNALLGLQLCVSKK